MSAGTNWLRQQYPQYADVPDSTLLAGFKQKYYPDVDELTFRAALEKKARASSFAPVSSLEQSGAQINQPRPAAYNRLLALMPTVGGAAGGMLGASIGALGGPAGAVAGGALGATAGGTAGEGLREYYGGAPSTWYGPALGGAEQGVYDLAGQGIVHGITNKIAPAIAEASLRLTPKLKAGFPGVGKTVLSLDAPASAAAAAPIARAARQASSADLTQLLTDAGAAGKTFAPDAVLVPTQAAVADQTLLPSEQAAIQRLSDQWRAKFAPGQTLTPLELKAQKARWQADAQPIYTQSAQGMTPLPLTPKQRFAAAFAGSAKNQLETIPGVAEQEANTQALIGAQRALTQAANKPSRSFIYPSIMGGGVGALAGHGLEGGAAGVGLAVAANNPTVQMAFARALNSPSFLAIARQSPRLAAALFSEMSVPADTTSQGGGQ